MQMKKTLLILASATLVTGAYAQSHVAEAAPHTDTKPQMAAEARKNAKPAGVVPVNDGSTARGQGSGVKETTEAEKQAEARKASREAVPHDLPVQGGTPK